MSKINIYYQSMFPGSQIIPKVLDRSIDDGLDVLVLGAYGSGSIPTKILPQIQRATQDEIPVFSIRQTTTDQWYTEWSDYKEQLLPGIYPNEVNAIARGMIPLQKDLVKLTLVHWTLQQLCKQTNDYQRIISIIPNIFSSQEWNERLNQIREEYGLSTIPLMQLSNSF